MKLNNCFVKGPKNLSKLVRETQEIKEIHVKTAGEYQRFMHHRPSGIGQTKRPREAASIRGLSRSNLYTGAVQGQPLHWCCPGQPLYGYPGQPLQGVGQGQPLHGNCPGAASIRELSKGSLYIGTVQKQPLHGSCPGAASTRVI
jgi:hypothetical protein